MKYIAHKDGERVQSVKAHLEGTAERAGDFAEKFGKREWGYCCGMLHDIGKYAKEFQKKIQENTDDRVDHATAGAQVCKEQGRYYPILSYCIAGHHAGLPDYGNTAISSSLCGRWKKRICDYQAYKDEIRIPELDTEPIAFDKDRNMDFALGTFIRMLYSCLVDADFLDTELFMKNGDTGRNSGESMEILQNRLKNHISEWLKNTDEDTINGRRTEILNNCIREGKQKEGIFRLTVPTGGGKTVASLAFALEHAVKNHKDRIIYVIPYTSIIEQNAQVFREILGEENVLENHCNVDYESSEEFKPMQLASENWDKPVVVTTNVQFFESLFANKSSKCRKIHNIANSVIILDEAQMLPMDYLKPCIAMLQELVDSYSASIVLCTATQPALDSFFSKNELIKELCPRMEEQFSFFKRVNYQNLGKIRQDHLIEKLKKENNALCIVNTKKAAQVIYKELHGEGIYHLSTSMYPKHRKRVLKTIRERLKNSEKCIVISTSLVEAGVDLDFATVYRQIAGLDSMIQAAGRCNREGKRELSNSIVCIFDLEEFQIAQRQRQQIDVSKGILQDYTDIADLKAITDYFTRLYHSRGTSLDKKKIMDEFQKMECNFAKVAKEFKLIEENTKTIFINRELDAEELLQELRIKGVTKEKMRKAGQYCIQVYDNTQSENTFFDKLNGAGMLRPIAEEMQDFYELVDGEQYSEEYGLDFSLEDGIALFV
ncbi:CRISPR-associated helicase Cas3' [Dorea sp. AM58-8]|uniref:CRISPR-associated helicase Cas3' n=1 Tax=Dorea sp. AM58-8 TaxID=2292346 RepID=UPI000E504046|nr:CRISPR-associated helicase Cas3' [Dorea sp. AM58-8]RGY79087.1 CRISPR-associated helicase Cas3' [Dorea sp. AM58-8]